MFSIELTPQEIARCHEFATLIDRKHTDTRTHRERFDGGDSWTGNAIGKIVEFGAAKYYGVPDLVDFSTNGYDGKVDFWIQGRPCDVKRVKSGGLMSWLNCKGNRDVVYHPHFDALVFIYASLRAESGNVVDIIGELTAAEMVNVSTKKPGSLNGELCYCVKMANTWRPGALLPVMERGLV